MEPGRKLCRSPTSPNPQPPLRSRKSLTRRAKVAVGAVASLYLLYILWQRDLLFFFFCSLAMKLAFLYASPGIPESALVSYEALSGNDSSDLQDKNKSYLYGKDAEALPSSCSLNCFLVVLHAVVEIKRNQT